MAQNKARDNFLKKAEKFAFLALLFVLVFVLAFAVLTEQSFSSVASGASFNAGDKEYVYTTSDFDVVNDVSVDKNYWYHSENNGNNGYNTYDNYNYEGTSFIGHYRKSNCNKDESSAYSVITLRFKIPASATFITFQARRFLWSEKSTSESDMAVGEVLNGTSNGWAHRILSTISLEKSYNIDLDKSTNDLIQSNSYIYKQEGQNNGGGNKNQRANSDESVVIQNVDVSGLPVYDGKKEVYVRFFNQYYKEESGRKPAIVTHAWALLANMHMTVWGSRNTNSTTTYIANGDITGNKSIAASAISMANRNQGILNVSGWTAVDLQPSSVLYKYSMVDYAAYENIIASEAQTPWDTSKRWSAGAMSSHSVGLFGQSHDNTSNGRAIINTTVKIPAMAWKIGFTTGIFVSTDASNGNQNHSTTATVSLLNGSTTLSSENLAISNTTASLAKNSTTWSFGNTFDNALDISNIPVSGGYRTITLQLQMDTSKTDASGYGDRQNAFALLYNMGFSIYEYSYTENSSNQLELSNDSDLRALSYYTNNNYTSALTSKAYSDENYIVKNNITMNSAAFTPIGNSTANSFKGYIDGNNCTISNLTVNTGSASHGGLFGFFAGYLNYNSSANSPTDKTLTVSGSVNGSGGYLGGIAGELRDGGVIANCVNNASIGNSATGDYVGGVVGIFHGGKLINCTNNAAVRGINDVGGIVGRLNNATVTGCYNTGNVSGTTNIGGIVGNVNDGNAILNHCFNDATTVTGTSYLGGIAGISKADISHCVNWCTIGAVNNTTSTYVGGIAGSIASGKSANYCYSLYGKLINGGSNIGGLLGSGSAANSWVIHDQAKKAGLNSIGRDIVNLAGMKIMPATQDAGGNLVPAVNSSGNEDWKIILTNEIKGVTFADLTIAAKKYLSISNGSGAYAAADILSTTPSGAGVPTTETITVSGAIRATNASSFVFEIKDFGLIQPTSLVYNGDPKTVVFANGVSLPVGYSGKIVYAGADNSGAAWSGTTAPKNAGGYTVTATATVGSGVDTKILGINIINPYNIQKFSITPGSGNANVSVGYFGQSSSPDDRIYWVSESSVKTFGTPNLIYNYNKATYTEFLNYVTDANKFFKVFFRAVPTDITDAAYGGEFTVEIKNNAYLDTASHSHLKYVEFIIRVPDNNTNFSGTVSSLGAYIMDGDFAPDGDGNSKTFDIGSWANVLRLSQVVNGADAPWDPSFTDKAFAGYTFNLHGGIKLSASEKADKIWSDAVDTGYGFRPIGKDAALPFKGSFSGVAGAGAKPIVTLDIRLTAAVASEFAQYSGLFGYVSGGTFRDFDIEGAVESSWYSGGVAGYAASKATFVNIVNRADVRVKSNAVTGVAGGIVGLIESGSITDCVNYGKISGELPLNNGDMLSESNGFGGIAGQSGDKANRKAIAFSGNAGAITASSVFAKIENCVNNGKVTAGTEATANSQNAGGIVGYAMGGSYILKCENNAEVKGLRGVGGIAGRLFGAALENCLNHAGVSTYSSGDTYSLLGGIAGAIYEGSRVNYCVNEGAVSGASGKNGVGGIVGRIGGATGNSSYDYADSYMTWCYNFGAVSALNVTTVGGVVGRLVIAGANNIASCFAFLPDADKQTAALDNGLGSWVAYTISSNGATLTPTYASGATVADTAWNDILTKNITGFRYEATPSDGQYLYVSGGMPASVKPRVSSGYGGVLQNATVMSAKITARYDFGGYVKTDAADIVLNIRNIEISSHLIIYGTDPSNGYDHHTLLELPSNKTFAGTIGSLILNVYYKYTPAGNAAAWSDWVKNPQNIETAGLYNAFAEINDADGVVLGRRSKSFGDESKELYYIIEQAQIDITGSSGDRRVWFGYKGLASNSGKRTEVPYLENYYTLDEMNADGSMPSVVKALVFDDPLHNYFNASSFVLYYYMSGCFEGELIEGAECDYTIDLTNAHATDAGGATRKAVLTGANNYTGTLTVYFVPMNGDFGRLAGGSGAWGSEGNPYVIDNWAQLVRLKQIVSGENAWDSVRGQGVVPADSADVQCAANGFAGGFFKQIADVGSAGDTKLVAAYGFAPIGNYLKPFNGSYDGGYLHTDGKTVLNREIYYNLSAGDDAGLFGCVSGSTIKNLTVNGAISGTNRVGGVIGYAYASTLENLSSGASVTATGDYAGGIAGYVRSLEDAGGNWLSGEMRGKFASSGSVTGGSYVGGISGCVINIKMTLSLPEVTGTIAAGGNYLGGLFGFASGTGYTRSYNDLPQTGDENVIRIQNSNCNPTLAPSASSNYVGGLVGRLEKAVIYVNGSWINARAISAGDNIGGAAGALSFNASLIGGFLNRNAITGKSYVGGIIGFVEAGAGASYGANINAVGGASRYDNSSTISGVSYIGGIIGASNDPAGANAAVSTRIVAVCQNTAATIRATGSYAGGIIGAVSGNTLLDIKPNDENASSFVGRLDAGTNTTVSGASYVGGIAGYLNNKENSLTNVYGTATVSASGDYAGGLVGRADAVIITGCFVTNNGDNSVIRTTSKVTAGNADGYAGGLVGYMDSGRIESSLSLGFNYGTVSATKGGLTGVKHAANASINGSWAIYIDGNPDKPYEMTSANTNGKYILLGDGTVTLPSAQELKNLVFSAGAKTLKFKFISPTQVSGNNPDGMRQLAFYDASGYEKRTDNAFIISSETAANEYGLSFDYTNPAFETFSVFKTKIRFTNVAEYDKPASWVNAYVKPNNDERYSAVITKVDTSVSNQYKISGYINYTVNGKTAVVGSFGDIVYNKGSSAAPHIISSLAQWRNFCEIINGTSATDPQSTFSGQTVKLTADINIGYLYDNSTLTSYLAGDVNDGENPSLATNHYFAGTFDGGGYTITLNYTGSSKPHLSLFPNASGATFRNLTVAGNISTTGYDVAGFVGKPFGRLQFYNCTNKANITASRLAAGFAANSTTIAPIILEDCLNTGAITTTAQEGSAYAHYEYGTGGFVAQIANETIIESCKNEGAITAPQNLGGIVGIAKAKLTLKNCANSGTILGNSNTNKNHWSCAGGLLGKTDTSGYLYAYACYNSGLVQGESNLVGGIVGSIGDYYPQAKGTTGWNDDYINVGGHSVIAYCYNTGDVRAGGNSPKGGDGWFLGRVNLTGTDVGGIVGLLGSCDMSYCYNTGTITTYGCVGYIGSWQVHAGGLIGQAIPSGDRKINISYSYNTGAVENREATSSKCRYSAGIVGYLDNDSQVNNTKVTNCYSLKNQYFGNGSFADYNTYSGTGWSVRYMKSGYIVDSLTDLTAVMSRDLNIKPYGDLYGTPDQDGSGNGDSSTSNIAAGFGSVGNVQTLVDANGNSINPDANSSYLNGTLGGWIYPYGCLPQLAVFALDTKRGLSMHSVSYGENQYGEFVRQKSGDEFSPYIIRDGVDMLSLIALTDASANSVYWTGKDKYIEVANGKNVSDGTRVTSINMPTLSVGQFPDTPEVKANTYTYNNGLKGKSYHLLAQGALMRDRFNGGDLYGPWKDRNYSYGTNSFDAGTGLDKINFYPIGMYGGERHFGGSISGASGSGNVVINDLKIDRTVTGASEQAFAGLFGRVQDASVSNFIVKGSITARAAGSANVAYAGVVGYAGGSSMISSLNAGGVADGLSVRTETTASSLTSAFAGYAGGIVGYASTGRYSSGTDYTTYTLGDTLTISSCTSYANVTGFKNGIGGILGYADGNKTSVTVSGCETQGGTISSTGEPAMRYEIGGIAGGRTYSGAKDFTFSLIDCSVGNRNYLTPTVAAITVKGASLIGGVIGFSKGDTSVISGNVYGNAAVERDSISDNATYGTAFGGITGAADGKIALRGNLGFYGALSPEYGSSAAVNVGGIVGYMGAGANIANGLDGTVSNITVAGSFAIGNRANKRVGGIAGYVKDAAFNGIYTVTSNINAPASSFVGGFIGYNGGTCDILAGYNEAGKNVQINIGTAASGGSVAGKDYVGGFIGYNQEGKIINIGQNSYNGVSYNGMLNVHIYSDADGKKHVGGFLGSNYGEVNGIRCDVTNHGKVGAKELSRGTALPDDENDQSFAGYFGGIFGSNYIGGAITLSGLASFTNGGQVGSEDKTGAHAFYNQQYVGGIIGSTAGGFNVSGAMKNDGAVNGNRYVGGSAGRLRVGAINSGSYSNNGEVYGFEYVGGVIGIVSKDASITTDNGETRFTNTGAVHGMGEGSKYVGGSIGFFAGTIDGSALRSVIFSNTGRVIGANDSGGIIGVLTGSVDFAQFTNQGELSFTGGDGIGGSIGRISSSDASISQPTSVTNSRFEYVNADTGAKTTLTATGVSTSGNGGVGGVIGSIDASDISDGTEWSGNRFYVNGDVTADRATNVGGVIGKIDRAYVSVSNMLAYMNTISGYDNVGGIVGYNGSTNTIKGTAEASLYNCFNIAGTITCTLNTTGAGGGKAGGIVGGTNGSAYTFACYWVASFSNDVLAHSDINNLSETLNQTFIKLPEYPDSIPQTPVDPVTNLPCASWERFVEVYNAAHTDDKLYVNNTGEVGRYVQSKTSYITGNTDETTGYYFLYADDAIATAGARENINTIHANPMGGVDNLEYWKYIANAYFAGEAELSDPERRSSIVESYGMVSEGHIYATAHPGMSVGYYLYMQNTKWQDALIDVSYADGKYFIDADTTSAGNVVIFYKALEVVKEITYNGVERYAPISGITDMRAVAGVTDADKPGTYFYVLNGGSPEGSLNYGKDVGKYAVNALIYFIYKKDTNPDGTVELGFNMVGSLNLGTENGWEIVRRKLDATASVNNAPRTYDAKFSTHYIDFTVSGLPYADLTDTKPINKDGLTIDLSASADGAGISGIAFEDVTGDWSTLTDIKYGTVYRKQLGTVNFVGKDKLYNNETVNNYTSGYEYRVYFKDAGEYRASVRLGAASNSNRNANFTMTAPSEQTLTIERALLSVKNTAYNDGLAQSRKYNGSPHGMTLEFGGFMGGENGQTQYTDQTGSKDNTKLIDHLNELMSVTSTTTVTGITPDTVGKGSASGSSIHWEATQIGKYTVFWNKSDVGKNYRIDASGNIHEWAITQNTASVTWNWTDGESRVYSGGYQSRTAEVIADKEGGRDVTMTKAAWDSFTEALILSLSPISGEAVTVDSVWGANKGYSATVTFKAKNVIAGGGKYTASVSARADASIALTANTRTFGITPFGLTLTAAASGASPYTYNAQHQGYTSIAANLLGSDYVSGNIRVLSKTGTFTATLPTNSKTITLGGAKNAGTYSITFTSASANYTINAPTRFDWTINKRELVASNDSAFKTHSGSYTYSKSHQGLSYISLSGMQSGDTVSGIFNITPSTSPAGLNATPSGSTRINVSGAVNVGSYSLSIALKTTNGNYTLSGDTQSSWTIVPRALSITSRTGTDNQPFDNGSYVYTSYHAGLKSVVIGNLCSGDTAALITVTNSHASMTDSYSGSAISFGGTINVGTYSTKLASNSANYVIGANNAGETLSWRITRRDISIGNVSIIENTIYDGTLHTGTLTVTIDGGGSQTGSGQATFGADTIVFTLGYGQGNQTGVCNAGTYTVSADPTAFSATRDGENVKANYNVVNSSSSSARITIEPRHFTIAWSEPSAFVYTGTEHGRSLFSATFIVQPPEAAKTNNFSVNTVNGYSGDKINFALTGDVLAINAKEGVYTVNAAVSSVTGTNEGGTPVIGNYVLDGAASAAYTIAKSKVAMSIDSVSNRVYDALRTVPVSSDGTVNGITISYTLAATNGGKAMPNDGIRITSVSYDSADAGIRTVTVDYVVAADYSENYEITSYRGTYSDAIITPRPLTVILNMRGSRAYKTFDNTDLFAKAVNELDKDSITGRPYRMGQSFTVSGFAPAEATGNITVNAVFREAGANREAFDRYVNNVYKNGDNYEISRTQYYKKLVFTIGDNSATGGGGKASNYTMCIADIHPAQAANSITVYDSRDTDPSHKNGADMPVYISIEKYSISVGYTNTTQSYANNDNSYNTVWEDVGYQPLGGNVAQGIGIAITQGWKSGEDGSGMYKKYTLIRGAADSAKLGAKLTDSSNAGLALNYTLQNQPTLIIGYFVADGDNFEVGTLAGLLLATYYYNLNFVTSGVDAPVMEQFTFETVCTASQYDNNTGNKVLDGVAYATWTEYIEALVQKRHDAGDTAFDVVFLPEFDNGDGTTGAWGYWRSEMVPAVTYLKFKQVTDISAVFTAKDIEILGGQFGTNWGEGKANLTNVINTGIGNAAVILGSLFEGTFAGVYNGNGYAIDNLNIVSVNAVSSAEPILLGLFAEIGNAVIGKTDTSEGTEIIGSVVGVNVRGAAYTLSDYSASANTIYVGGIAAKSGAQIAVSDSTFIGSIKIYAPSAKVFAGGLIGAVVSGADYAVERAFAAGSLYITAAEVNAGGITGELYSGGRLNSVISMLEIYSTASGSNIIGGIIGKYNGTVTNVNNVIEGSSAYLKGSVAKGGSAPAFVNKIIGSAGDHAGITYDALRAGSVSGYGADGYDGSVAAKGVYDVISDHNFIQGSESKARRSPRIGDIVDTEFLGFTITEQRLDAKGYYVYVKSASSKLTGTAVGTSADPILIGNVQHVTLIRMFRFAAFELKCDVYMSAGTIGAAFDGAFYGSFVTTAFKIKYKSFETGAAGRMFALEASALPLATY